MSSALEEATEYVIYPAFLMVAAGITLFFYNNLVGGVFMIMDRSFASGGAIQKAVQQYAVLAKPYAESILGKRGASEITVDRLLLGAVVICLLGIWRTLDQQRREAKKEKEDAKKASADNKKVSSKATSNSAASSE